MRDDVFKVLRELQDLAETVARADDHERLCPECGERTVFPEHYCEYYSICEPQSGCCRCLCGETYGEE